MHALESYMLFNHRSCYGRGHLKKHEQWPGVCGMKLLIHSQTSTMQSFTFGDGYMISIRHFTMDAITYPCLANNQTILVKTVPDQHVYSRIFVFPDLKIVTRKFGYCVK